VNPEQPVPLATWHAIVASHDPAGLAGLLADDVEFRSPALYAPQQGKALTTAYLSAALAVLGPTLRYVHEWFDESSAALEFEADLDGTYVNGIDILRWNPDGRVTGFSVLVRPLRALERLIELMRAQLGG
jgi:hypothetical protein